MVLTVSGSVASGLFRAGKRLGCLCRTNWGVTMMARFSFFSPIPTILPFSFGRGCLSGTMPQSHSESTVKMSPPEEKSLLVSRVASEIQVNKCSYPAMRFYQCHMKLSPSASRIVQ